MLVLSTPDLPTELQKLPHRQIPQSLAVLWNLDRGEIPRSFYSEISPGTKGKPSALNAVKAKGQSMKAKGWQRGPVTQ